MIAVALHQVNVFLNGMGALRNPPVVLREIPGTVYIILDCGGWFRHVCGMARLARVVVPRMDEAEKVLLVDALQYPSRFIPALSPSPLLFFFHFCQVSG